MKSVSNGKPFVIVLTILYLVLQSVFPTKVLNAHPKLVVISFDGFRSDYLSKTDTPFMDSLIRDGVSVSHMKSQFPTKTFGNHQSLVTGLYGESHGIIDLHLFDPKYNKKLFGKGKYKDKFWNFDVNVVPIWILNERAGDGRISGVSFPGSDQPYGQNKTLPTHFVSYNRRRPYKTRIDLVHKWLTDKMHPANLIFMYFDQPDQSGHLYGPNSSQVKAQIQSLDGITGYLINKLKEDGIFDQVNIILCSDHGMEEVNVGSRINLTDLVKLDRNMYSRYGYSPVINILPMEGKNVEVYEAFQAASIGQNFSVYRKDKIPKHWYYQNNRRIMPLIVVADPGYVFDDFRRKLVDTDRKFGVHGYDNGAESMKAFFIAHGPAFRNGFVAKPFENVDLFPLIALMMSFAQSPNNGSLSRIIPILLPMPVN